MALSYLAAMTDAARNYAYRVFLIVAALAPNRVSLHQSRFSPQDHCSQNVMICSQLGCPYSNSICMMSVLETRVCFSESELAHAVGVAQSL